MANRPQQLPAVHEAWLPREHALHRPRHGGRQLTALICALIFFATPSLMWLGGARPAEIENHPLAGFPSIASGWSFFTDLPTWATDQLVFRAGAVTAADAISRTFFGEPAPFDQGGTGNPGPLPGSPQSPPAGQVPGQDTPHTEPGYRRVIEGGDGWLYYGFDVDGKCEPQRPMEQTFAHIDRLREAVESSGRKFVFVIAPDKTTMAPQHLPDSYAGKQCSRLASQRFWRLAGSRDYVVDIRDELAAQAQLLGRPVYFRNDTHWTDEGAIVLTRAIAEAVQPGVTKAWRAAGVGWVTGTADLPRMLGRSEKKSTLRYELRPDGQTDRTTEPLLDLERPQHHTASPIEQTVNSRTLVFGDSFALASSRYLPAGFSDLTILGYPSMADYERTVLKAFTDAEVVVVQAVERSVAASTLPFIDEGFLQQARQAMARRPIR
ncbi:hypothetical protein SacmaDRAFT_4953 [Saccharomonospora marina XMU15]|uniref:AlgX/AlgJ SGNH hydrolase-like domain-containing protein n=1 Tax=Saccharomonospora marina XMU15 TaxID=882083 RepID=H5X165_9PSEU|nr:hypothetical protein [Saccharomonospora marina]EHR53124.1 hypothetical protein SacmaDRAFT_4953 [Saccharomonospora marina XMU15]